MKAEDLLHEIAFFANRVDGRLPSEYERGWNDAVDHITAKARAWFQGQGTDADNHEGEEECAAG